MFKAGMKQCFIGLMIFLLVFPVTVNGAGFDNSVESNVSQEAEENVVEMTLKQEIMLENGISIKEGQKIFVHLLNKEEGTVQVGLEENTISLENLELSSDSEVDRSAISNYKEDEETTIESITLEPKTNLIEVDSESVLGTVTDKISLPIFEEKEDKYILIIGNKKIYVQKDEVKTGTEGGDAGTLEESTTEEPIKENVETDSSSITTDDSPSLDEEEKEADSEEKVTEEEKMEIQKEEEKENTLLSAASDTASQLTFKEAGFLKPNTETLSIYDNSSGSLVKVGDLVDEQSYKIIETMGNWHKIKFGNGYGFVWKDSTTPSLGTDIKNPNNSGASSLYEVHSDKTLSVYDNTSGSLVQMGNIAIDVKYPVIAEVGNWLKIDFAGRIGYIYKPATKKVFTSEHKYFTVSTEFLSVYDNSSGALVKVGALEHNQQYPIVALSGHWIKIKFGNGYGFVWKDSTEPVSTPAINNLNKGLNNNGRPVASNVYLSVYDNTSGSLVKFGAIDPSVSYPVIDRVGNWYRIDFSGRIGFIYAPSTYTDFYSTDHYFEVNKSATAIYADTTSTSKVVGALLEGKTIKRVGDTGKWHKVQFGNSYGYVLKTDTTLGYERNFKPKQGNPTDETFTTIQDVPVMDNSTGKLIPFAEIKKGVTYPIVSRSGNWIEINLGDRTGWVYKTGVQIGPLFINSYSDYTFQQALDIQLSKAPQSDTTSYDAYVRWDAFDKIEGDYGFVNDVWNVRGGPGTSYWMLNSPTVVAANGPLIKGEKVQILGEQTVEVAPGQFEKWYQINFYRTYREDGNGGYKAHYRSFVNADPTETAYFMNPESFVTDDKARFQFLLLSESADADADRINSEMLTNRGNLSGKGAAFVEAGKLHSINEIYLVSHSILETGAGSSRESSLLKGYKISSVKGQSVPEKTVYNVYGIAAFDSCPQSPSICAAEFAYEQEWFSVDAAIIGGAKFIGEKYIYRAGNNQNTLYEMRWNPDVPGTHQYATDIGWAYKQAVNYFSSYYSILGLKPKTFEIPVYQPSGGK
ncbi:glucosaminidase domain-containing protein [Rossellomorea sp. KS-H15a]|uniref:glucosaminidase domain-containing protein n=1 Tax=Rossellomorea sp. KS-H15a TaxID=2963940 RepID=UPI0020C6EE54|nr:glucosaminidase domain-containing protein [Rossellomorea sp. KS-H15a]UTE77339.1 glucosaminidase domain-containing protein [Rossellomorea sp. KS-H15a]